MERVEEGVCRREVFFIGVIGFGHVPHDVMLREKAAAIDVITEENDFVRVQRLDVGQHG